MDKNVVMDFECTRGCWDTFGIVKGDRCSLVKFDDEHIPGIVCVAIARADGARISLVAKSIEDFAKETVRFVGPSGQPLYLKKVMRRPWRYDQMLRARIDAEHSLGSVTHLHAESV